MFEKGELVTVRPSIGKPYSGKIVKNDCGKFIVIQSDIDNKKRLVRIDLVVPIKLEKKSYKLSRSFDQILFDEINFISNPKKKSVKNNDYLEYIRNKPCCSCSNPPKNDPHHWSRTGKKGGMGAKTDDYRTVPLCRECHDHWHNTGALPRQTMVGTKQHFANCQVDYLIEWITKKEKNNDKRS